MVDAELDRAPQHGAGGVGVAGRAEDAGAGELHRAEADAADGLVAEERGRGMADRLRYGRLSHKKRLIMGVAPPPTRREELAGFLRHHRQATTPESVGLPRDGRRRTPGLRREEVSQLAGVGLSWYTWLEQGRDITPSAGVLDALARVLGLDPAERAHLFDLAGVALPVGRAVPDGARGAGRIVDGLGPTRPTSSGRARRARVERRRDPPRPAPAAPDGVPNMLWWMFTAPARRADLAGHRPPDPRALPQRPRPAVRRPAFGA